MVSVRAVRTGESREGKSGGTSRREQRLAEGGRGALVLGEDSVYAGEPEGTLLEPEETRTYCSENKCSMNPV